MNLFGKNKKDEKETIKKEEKLAVKKVSVKKVEVVKEPCCINFDKMMAKPTFSDKFKAGTLLNCPSCGKQL